MYMPAEDPLTSRPWRRFTSAFEEASASIRTHKLRSFLTLLGVIIGVAAVVFVGAAIDGLGVYAKETTARAFGSESFMVSQVAAAGQLSRREYLDKITRNKPIRADDARFVEDLIGDRIQYSPYRQQLGDVRRDNFVSEFTSIIGVAASMAAIRDIEVADGRFFTEQEERTRTYVAVIGETVRTTLFPGGASPLNQTIRVQGMEFRVVGLLESLGSAFGRDQDKLVYIPYGAFERLYGSRQGLQLFGRARPSGGLTLDEAVDETRVALRTRFRVRPGQSDVFDILTPEATRAFIDQILGLVAAVAVPVTGISLVVGGIVIMNIMLVSVTERTREIGLRKSLGARNADIMFQVLIEAVSLALIGGALGVSLGAAASVFLGAALDLTVQVSAGYILLSLAVSTLVGVASGWYPARRAARLDPVEALRAE